MDTIRLEPDNKSLLFLASFIRSLSHKLRTDLSVIKNDLTYFSSQLPEKECERSLSKASQIAETLRLCSQIGSPIIKREIIKIKELELYELAEIDRDSLAKIEDENIFCDKEKCRTALKTFATLLKQCNLEAEELPSAVIDLSDQSLLIKYLCKLPQPHLVSEVKAESFDSLTKLILLTLNLDNPLAPIVDSILLANGGSVFWQINHDGIVEINLTLSERYVGDTK